MSLQMIATTEWITTQSPTTSSTCLASNSPADKHQSTPRTGSHFSIVMPSCMQVKLLAAYQIALLVTSLSRIVVPWSEAWSVCNRRISMMAEKAFAPLLARYLDALFHKSKLKIFLRICINRSCLLHLSLDFYWVEDSRVSSVQENIQAAAHIILCVIHSSIIPAQYLSNRNFHGNGDSHNEWKRSKRREKKAHRQRTFWDWGCSRPPFVLSKVDPPFTSNYWSSSN